MFSKVQIGVAKNLHQTLLGIIKHWKRDIYVMVQSTNTNLMTIEMSRFCIWASSDDSIVLSLIWRLYRLLIESIMFVGTFLSNCDTEDDGSGKEDDPICNAK